METVRKPFQGILNIVRFNWHFYLAAIVLVLALSFIYIIAGKQYQPVIFLITCLVAISSISSLLVSFYIYDLSGLYKLSWLDESNVNELGIFININAGFDESSSLIVKKYPKAILSVYDFYDPLKHTEISIKRARKIYLPFNGTSQITTSLLPLPDNYADHIFLIFAAHEIRCQNERSRFFKEVRRVLKPGGSILILEHLRDLPNFLAYNIGFFHFLSRSMWYHTFKDAGLVIKSETKLNPFITNFTLHKNGTSS